jgi:hypothetical protein
MTSLSPIPSDDTTRQLTVADPDGAGLQHVSVAGGTYTIVVSRAETSGRYCLSTCSCQTAAVRPHIVTISRRCSRFWRDSSTTRSVARRRPSAPDRPSAFRPMLRMCSRICRARWRACSVSAHRFLATGLPVDSRTAPAPKVSPEAQAEKGNLLAALAPKYRTEILAR